MPSSDPIQRFRDIIENIEAIERFTEGMDLRGFAETDQTIRAAKYSDLAADLCPSVPWREIRGLGNRLRHDYQSIDVGRIWLLIERDLPPLKAACHDALRRLEEDGEA